MSILLTTAATTPAAALKASPWITAVLATSSLIVAGQKRIFNWHDSWLALASGWAELQVAINEYRLKSMDGRHSDYQEKLVNKVNEIISTEVRTWAARRHAVAEQEKKRS